MNDPDIQGGGARKVLQVESDAGGMRLDQWLARATAPELSRSRIQALIRDGAVRVGGAVALEARAKVAPGDVVEVDVPPPQVAAPEAEAIPLDILFEDNQLVVVNKPAGMVVHPAPGNPDQTLVNALIAHCGDSLSGIGGVKRPGIVHRIDKDTSGLMVAAKNDQAHQHLSAAFARHDIERSYHCVVWGMPQPREGRIEGNIGRSSQDSKKMAVVRGSGKHAVTHYRVLQNLGDGAALLHCRLETGRTHQIRVHLSTLGYPLIGDPLYGRATPARRSRLSPLAREAALAFPRQALHAATLGFQHPRSGEMLRWEAPLPPDLTNLISGLQG